MNVKYKCIKPGWNIKPIEDVKRIRHKYTTHSFHYDDECSSTLFLFFLKSYSAAFFDIIHTYKASAAWSATFMLIYSHGYKSKRSTTSCQPMMHANVFCASSVCLLPIVFLRQKAWKIYFACFWVKLFVSLLLNLH